MKDYGFYKQVAPTALSVGDSLYFQPRSGDMFVVTTLAIDFEQRSACPDRIVRGGLVII
jgi:hypothetical protein